MLCRQINYVFSLSKVCNARFASCSTVLDFKDIPSPKGLPFVGTLFSLLVSGGAGKLHEYMDKRHKQLGPIFKDNVGPVTAVFVSDPYVMWSVFAQEGKYPLHIKPEAWLVYNEKHKYSRGLFFMDGEKWLHHRRVMNNILLKGDLTWIENSCDVASDVFLDRIAYYSEKNIEFPNLEEELYKLSMNIIVSLLLGAESYRLSHKTLQPLVKKLASTVHIVFETTTKLQLISAKLAAKYNIPRWRRFEKSVQDALETANEVIDYLEKNLEIENGLLRKMHEENVENIEIRRIVADLILGAGDTTAFTMEWMLYLISKHKEIQERLRNDDKALLKNVLRETLRLYPVAPFLTRFLPDNVTVGGFSIPAGTLVIMSIYTSGRDEKYFKNPEQFLPDRWLRNSTHGTATKQASLPFAIGARSCIGKKIAETQLMMTLSKIVKGYDVELCNTRDIDIVLKMIAKPSETLRLKFNKI